MIAEIIAVGTEILMGQILNSNAQYLARQFAALGFDHYFQITVGDNMERLTHTITSALSRSNLIILTGGLGPTEDDLTKYAVAQVAGVEMLDDAGAREHLHQYFAKIGREITPNNYRQCEFPKGSVILPNSCGTAPGCLLELNNKIIVVLPGPPHEMKAMFEASVMPYILTKSDHKLHSRMLRIFGIGESALEHMLRDIIDTQTNPTLATYASVGEVTLRVTAKCATEEEGKQIIQPTLDDIARRVGKTLYSYDNEPLPQVVFNLLQKTNKTLAIAESLTGGSVSSELIGIPGMSQYFLEGCVVYSDEAKVRLGVSKDTLSTHTAISKETAIEMARAVRMRANADIGISTTGNAGPAAASGQPIGLYFIGLSTEKGEECLEVNNTGSRQRLRAISTLYALDQLRQYLQSIE